MATLKMPDSQMFDTKMLMHTSTHNSDKNLTEDIQNLLSNASRKLSIFIMVNRNKGQVKRSVQTDSIMCKTVNIFSIKMLKCIVLKTIFLDCDFAVHTKNYMVHTY